MISLPPPGGTPSLLSPPLHLGFKDAVAALIVAEDGRYLVQLRDDRPDIFYPAHWGLFGGAVDDGESPEQALRRELREELKFDPARLIYFTRFDYDCSPFAAGTKFRIFFEAPLKIAEVDSLRLGEGQKMALFSAATLLLDERVTPYDSFAIWMHYTARRRSRTESTPIKT